MSSKKTTAHVCFIIPKQEPGFLSDTAALQTVSSLYRGQGLTTVVADPAHPYSLVYRFCQKKGIRFEAGAQPYNAFDFKRIISSYSADIEPRIVYLTQGCRENELEKIAKQLAKKGHRAEIRKLY